MKVKKVIALLLSTLIFAASAAGCTGGNTATAADSASSSASSKSEGEAATLTFAIWDKNQQPAMQAMADAFTNQNPNIKINIECTNWSDYWTKMDAAAQGGTLPDLMWMHIAQISKYVKGNMLELLDDRIKADNVDLSQFPEALVQGGQSEGKQYGIPKDFDTIGLWYNKALFDAKKVPYPTDAWTWDDMVFAAQKLTDAKTGVYGVAAGYDTQQTTYNTIPMAGGYVISPDKKSSGYALPATIKGLQCWIDLISKYKVSPTQQQLTDTTSTAMFESGKVAMAFLGSWVVSEMKSNDYTKDKVDVVKFPSFNGAKKYVINGLTYAMSSSGKHKDAAWEFLKYLGSKDAQLISAQMGAAIPALNGTQADWVKATPNIHLQSFIDMVSDSVPYPADPSMPDWNTSEAQIFPKAWSGQIALEDAAKQVSDIMNQAIKNDQ